MVIVFACLLAASRSACADDWNTSVRSCVARHDLPCVHRLVEAWLAQSPHDLDALTWRARLTAWSKQWSEAEKQYHAILAASPGNTDALLGLADVHLWSGQLDSALATLDEAERAHAPATEVLSRRARVMVLLHRDDEAQQLYRKLLAINPADRSARQMLQQVRAAASRHLLRLGSDTDTFSYTNAANLEIVTLLSRWNERWSTIAQGNFSQRFGQTAEGVAGAVTYHLRTSDWITIGGSLANQQDVVAHYGLSGEFGHGWKISNGLIRGLELNLRQRELWFSNSQIETFGGVEVLYFPRRWMFTVATNAIRTRINDSRVSWIPAGFAQLTFPIAHHLDGNILYGVGAENFLTVDQIGRFSAHTYGGGMKLRLNEMQEITCNIAAQQRTQHRSQFSMWFEYGIRF
jgi:tetratricopeptide (TPR) repeat protein